VHVIREIKEQISWLEEEAQAKPPVVGKACSSLDTNVHAQQLMQLEAGVRVLKKP
jgi:hypothetical protein